MNDIEQAWWDATNCFLSGAGLPRLKPYRRTPCDSLVKVDDYQAHLEECEFCANGGSVLDRPESEERKLDDPRHNQAAAINRERIK